MIELVIIIALLLFIAILLIDYFKLRSSISKYNTIYIDTGGVKETPPSFIETIKGKTLNIKIDDKRTVTIQHFGFFENLFYVDRLYLLYNRLVRFMDQLTDIDIDDRERTKKQFIIYKIYCEIGKLIYTISKPWAYRGYKRDFYKKFHADTDWAYSVTEEMIKYWMQTKKKISFIPGAIENPQILGDAAIWRSLDVDSAGRTSIKPRYDISLN